MPPKTEKPERKNRKKTVDKKSSVNRNFISAIQKSQLTTLYYKGGFKLAFGLADSNYTTAFQMHSIWDPDWGNNTKDKSVQGFNLLSALFERYKVYGFKAKVTAQNMENIPIGFYIGGSDSTTWIPNFVTNEIFSDITSRKGIKSTILAPIGASNSKHTLTYTCHPASIVGITKEAWKNDSTCGALMGQNPALTGGKAPFLIVGMANPTDEAAPTGASVRFYIEMEFLTLVSDPRENNDQP